MPRDKIIEVLPSQWKLSPQISLRSDFQKGAEAGDWIGKTAPNSLAHKELNKLDKDVLQITDKPIGIEPISLEKPNRTD